MLYTDISELFQLGFQEEGSIEMIGIRDMHDNIMFYLITIVILVSYVLFILIYNYNKKSIANKYITHSTIIEIIWTLTPTLILIAIAIPSFKLLYSLEELLAPLISLKITGYQWYWNYSITDYDNIEINFDSYLLPESDLTSGQFRLLEVDNPVLLPILTPIRLLVTADDVIHCFSVPSLGIKIDAIPGRINQSALYILREGLYYGMCKELCGQQHAFMPILIKGVSLTEYYSWIFSFTNISYNSFIKTISILKSY